MEASGDVSGTAVANCANSGGGQGLRRTAAGGGGILWDVKRAYHNIALCKATTAQTIMRREGRPDIALHNLIILSYRTT